MTHGVQAVLGRYADGIANVGNSEPRCGYNHSTPMAITVSRTILCGLLILPVVVAGVVCGQTTTRDSLMALVGGTIYVGPTDNPIRNGVVLINGSQIVA